MHKILGRSAVGCSPPHTIYPPPPPPHNYFFPSWLAQKKHLQKKLDLTKFKVDQFDSDFKGGVKLTNRMTRAEACPWGMTKGCRKKGMAG